ncbi:hypothetical protein [Rhizobium sp. LjRoot258]|uniref:hypothetical protein n=1 Tax=Rhizobium sp. LjRoot258 TaxID=3342299 RepID=UPI003ECCBBD6
MMTDVRSRVTGIVLKRIFQQGSNVEQGDVLYQMDPAPFRAKVLSAEAILDSAGAAQKLASQKADGQLQLQRGNVTTQQDTESAAAVLELVQGIQWSGLQSFLCRHTHFCTRAQFCHSAVTLPP